MPSHNTNNDEVGPRVTYGLAEIVWNLVKDKMQHWFNPARLKQISRTIFLKFVYGINYYIFHVDSKELFSIAQYRQYPNPAKCQTMDSITKIFQPLSFQPGVRSFWESSIIEYHQQKRKADPKMFKTPSRYPRPSSSHSQVHSPIDQTFLDENDDDDISLTSATTTATADQHRIKDLEYQLAILQKQMALVLQTQTIHIQTQPVNLLGTDQHHPVLDAVHSNSSSSSSSPSLTLTHKMLPPIVPPANLPPPPPPPPSLLNNKRTPTITETVAKDQKASKPVEIPSAKSSSIMSDLKKGVTLRKVARSPGGRPLRNRVGPSRESNGLQSVFRKELEKRRQKLEGSNEEVDDGSSSTDEESIDWQC